MVRLTQYLFLSLLAVLLSACSVFEDDEEEVKKALTEINPLFEVDVKWDETVGDGIDSYFSRLQPVLAYDKLFAASRHGEVEALDPLTGDEIWSQSFVEWNDDGLLASVKRLWAEGLSARLTGIAAAYEKLFIGSENGTVLALNVDNGEQIWRAQVDGEILAAPYLDFGVVLLTTTSGKLIALNAENGEQLWSYESDVPPLTLRGISSPTASGGGAIFGTANGKVSVVIIENGQLAWDQVVGSANGATELERIVDIDMRPLIVGTVLYTATYNGTLAALDLRSGRIIWKREYGSYRPISYDGNNLYVVDSDSNLYAVDRRNGVELWAQTGLSYRNVTGLVPVGSFLVTADEEGYVHWLRQEDGEFVAREEVNGSGYYVEPIVDNRTVYLQARDGEIAAIETP